MNKNNHKRSALALLQQKAWHAFQGFQDTICENKLSNQLFQLDWSWLLPVSAVNYGKKELQPGIYLYDFDTFCFEYPHHKKDIFLKKKFKDPLEAFITAIVPLQVVYVSSSQCYTLENIFDSSPNNIPALYIVFVEQQASLTLTQNLPRVHRHSIISITFMLERYAALQFVYMQQPSQFDYFINSVFQKGESFFDGKYWLYAKEYTHFIMHLYMQDSHSNSKVSIGYNQTGREHMTLITDQLHEAPSTNSTVRVRGILADCASHSYLSRICIEKNSDNSYAVQEHKNIIKGDAVVSHATPSLEVHTNNVHCKHGSASGNLDIYQIHYVCSRGLDKFQAEKLLIDGFFKEIGLSDLST